MIDKPAASSQKDEEKVSAKNEKGSYTSQVDMSKKVDEPKMCFLCGESGHPIVRDHRGKKVIQYFCCKKFAEMSPGDRYKLLREKGLCHQCLAPGAPVDVGKHKVDCFASMSRTRDTRRRNMS